MAENEPSQPLPRVTIQFCTQCKWMLRAAYFAQELLSTFSLSLGEVALQPKTGGIFIVTIVHQPTSPAAGSDGVTAQTTVLWDRKAEGGFPETKELKRRVRDVIEPGRDLGHVDGHKAVTDKKVGEKEDAEGKSESKGEAKPGKESDKPCEDCS